jgi:hypothetical protein
MSSFVLGAEGWAWLAFRRLAEPVVARLTQSHLEPLEAAPDRLPDRLAGLCDVAVAIQYEEDAERWDGLG